GYYDNAVRLWITNNPGKQVTIYHIASFVKIGMEKAMSPGIILSGFRKTGIYPFNPDIFTEADFLPSLPFRPETPETSSTTLISQTPGSSSANDTEGAGVTDTSTPTTSACSAMVTDASAGGDGTPAAGFLGPLQIRGLPKAQTSTSASTRPKGRSMIPTDTPEKDAITARKTATREKKQRAERNKAARNLAAATGAVKKKATKKKVVVSSESEEDVDQPVPLMDSDASETWAEVEPEPLPAVEPESAAGLPRDLEEGDYVLVSVSSSKKKGAVKNYKLGQVLSTTKTTADVSFLKHSEKVKEKFSVCDPPELQSVSLKSVVGLLPKPSISGTKRQGYHHAFEVDFSKVRLHPGY
ncbi:DNA ligase 1, partial [Frankliniella fusca]